MLQIYNVKREQVIKEYKAENRASEIEQALKDLTNEYKENKSECSDDLCWLYDKDMEDYLHDMSICQKYALRNREEIAKLIIETLGLSVDYSFHTMHNYIDMEDMILRKGAISAKKNEIVLIPLNMRDGSIIATGLGNADWNYSAPHGAGRLMSRNQAKQQISLEEYQDSMNGIYSTSVNLNTIDESPMAYKNSQDIIKNIKDTVTINAIIKPIFNYKDSK